MVERYGLDAVVFRFFPPSPPAHPEVHAARAGVMERFAPGVTVPFGGALAAAAVEFALGRMRDPGDWRDFSVRKAVQAARQALRVSNEELEVMEGTLYGLEILLRHSDPGVAVLKRFLARPTAPLTRALFSALPDHLAADRERLERRLIGLEQTEYAPSPLITGDDLTAAGLAPGPVFKRVLDAVYDDQLEGRVVTREEALRKALEGAKEQRAEDKMS
jgi:hypothetical protein